MNIGKRMLEYRAKNGLSIETASEKCGISAQTWRYTERGLQDPSRVTMAKIELLIGKEDEE